MDAQRLHAAEREELLHQNSSRVDATRISAPIAEFRARRAWDRISSAWPITGVRRLFNPCATPPARPPDRFHPPALLQFRLCP